MFLSPDLLQKATSGLFFFDFFKTIWYDTCVWKERLSHINIIIAMLLKGLCFGVDDKRKVIKPTHASEKECFLFLIINTMQNNIIKNLEKLCNHAGVSGYERESGISEFLFKLIKNVNPNTMIDAVGNIVSIIENPGETIIIEAHMDEAGFTVEKNDKIVLSPQGIIKGEKVAGNNVFVVNKNIKGKITMSLENDFIFTPTDERSADKIESGDIVTFERSFVKEGCEIRASALDNRIGCSVLIEILTTVAMNGSKNRLVFVFSRKEEIDESSFVDVIDENKDATAIVVDAAYAQPVEFDMSASDVLIPILGNGCAVQTKGNGFMVLEKDIEEMKKIAKEKNIKIQEERAPQGFGKTNLTKMQKQGIGRGVVINVPVRDQHCQFAKTNLFDTNEAIRLIWELVR